VRARVRVSVSFSAQDGTQTEVFYVSVSQMYSRALPVDGRLTAQMSASGGRIELTFYAAIGLQAMEEGTLVAHSAIIPRGSAASSSPAPPRPGRPAEPAEVEMLQPEAARTG